MNPIDVRRVCSTTTLYSDCLCVDPTTTPFVPLLGEPKTFVAYAVSQFDTKVGVVPVVCPATTSVSKTEKTVAFNSDKSVECRRTHIPPLSTLRVLVEKCGLTQKTIFHPVLVRVSNRDYEGVVLRVGDGNEEEDAGRNQPRQSETAVESLEAQVRGLFFPSRDNYVPPA